LIPYNHFKIQAVHRHSIMMQRRVERYAIQMRPKGQFVQLTGSCRSPESRTGFFSLQEVDDDSGKCLRC
jgi:hypothetical protein